MKNLSSLAHKMLHTAQVNTLANAVKNAQGKSFAKSVEMATFLLKGYKWLKSEEGKTFLKDTALTQEEVVKMAYGLSKQQYGLYIRVAKATERLPQIAEEFVSQCDALQGAASYSLENFEKFIKKHDNSTANPLGLNEDEGNEEGGVSEANEVAVDTKAKPIVTFTFNGEAMKMNNVSLRITDKGEVKTTATKDDIAKAIAYLQKSLKQLKAETQAKVDVKANASVDKAKKNAKKQAMLDILQGGIEEEVTMDMVS